MKKAALSLTLAGAVAGTLCCLPGAARADVDVSQIDVAYHGGALMRHVRVATLFWGKGWSGTPLRDYLNGFYQAPFDDGRYMANLAQSSANGLQIDNGEFGASDTDEAQLPAKVSDAQIQAEIRAQVAAGKLPRPDAETLYVVFTPPQVVVVDSQGEDSVNDFAGYHDLAPDGQFAYAVIPCEEIDGDARLMTVVVSHELAEAVTDPEPELQRTQQGGWYDEQYGEIGNIPGSLLEAKQIGVNDFVDVLTGGDGTRYLVQKVWSVQDNAPVAFASGGGGIGQGLPGVSRPEPVTVVVGMR